MILFKFNQIAPMWVVGIQNWKYYSDSFLVEPINFRV